MIARILRRLRSPRRRSEDLSVEYRPRPDGQPDPGEVVWAWVAYEDDPTQGKDRPIVIIGRNATLLVGVALTTKNSGETADRFAVGTGAWDSQRRPSFAKTDRLLTLQPRAVRREGATFDRQRFDSLVGAIATRHGWKSVEQFRSQLLRDSVSVTE